MPHLQAALWVHYGDIDEDIDRDNQYLEDLYLSVKDVCKQSQCDIPGNKILFQHLKCFRYGSWLIFADSFFNVSSKAPGLSRGLETKLEMISKQIEEQG